MDRVVARRLFKVNLFVFGTGVKFRNTGVPYSVNHSLRISVYAVFLLKIKYFFRRVRVNDRATTFATVE